MFARSTYNLLFKLESVSRSGRLQGTRCIWQQSNPLVRQRPTSFLNIRQKTTTPPAAELLWASGRRMWNKMFDKYLLTTNIISSGFLMVIGDILAQEIQRLDGAILDNRRYDLQRLGKMFVVGALQGPLHHYVYLWMDRVFPGTSLRIVVRKILIDQLLMSPFCIVFFFYTTCFLEKKSVRETNMELGSKFPYIYLMDWSFWPAAQFINFRFLEPKYRVIYVNCVTTLYNVFISYMKHEFNVESI